MSEKNKSIESLIKFLDQVETKNISSTNIFEKLEDLYFLTVGHKLFTILKFYPSLQELERVYSNNPIQYPISGRKKVIDSNWTTHLLIKGKVYIGYNHEDIKRNFPDYQLIRKLGCGSVLNLPLIDNNKVIGSINLLHEEYWYKKSYIKTAETYSKFAVKKLV